MIDSRPATSARSSEELRFTRTTVVLLLLGSLLVGALAGGMSALLLRAAPQRGAPTSAPVRTDTGPLPAMEAAKLFTVTITRRGAAPTVGTPTALPLRQALGSGVILDLRGHILTTSQALRKNQDVQVVFSDGRAAPAALVSEDRASGLALLKVSTNVPGVPVFVPLTRLKVGEAVVAVGADLGNLEPTVDVGIVAALGRKATTGGQVSADNLIQTDASPPEGGQGGPLLNMEGELVGITLSTGTETNPWALALPAETAYGVGKRLIGGSVSPGASIGVLDYQTLNPKLAEQRGITLTSGAYITAVLPNSQADKKGLQPGDVIISLNGKLLTQQRTLSALLAAYRPGQTVTLQVVHPNLVQARYDIVLVSKPPPRTQPSPGAISP